MKEDKIFLILLTLLRMASQKPVPTWIPGSARMQGLESCSSHMNKGPIPATVAQQPST